MDSPPTPFVVIYDGGCRFCEAQMRTLARLDWRQQLSFVSLYDPRVASRYPFLSHQDLLTQIYVIGPGTIVAGGMDGIRLLSRRMPALWPLALPLHIPGSLALWRAVYRFVARRRYWFGRIDCNDGMCRLP